MIKVLIEGMSCENCVGHAREALATLPGVVSVEVSLEPGEARIEGVVEDEAIRQVLAEEEYTATAIVRG
ncbi:MAG: heavy metal-associated domain-containing protein [Candidatus Latescibacterota bacterium]|jgi:copper chaperone|nr:heavy metal-associated domain-containing protein [Candidatus Latescibacterota bacterium]|tara:strand:- start:241 stop:447 length:207 start_codon:yes stop_codon:yes gene_type:complete